MGPRGLPGHRLEELVDMELDSDADARVATWSVVTTESDGKDLVLVRGVKSRLNVTTDEVVEHVDRSRWRQLFDGQGGGARRDLSCDRAQASSCCELVS